MLPDREAKAAAEAERNAEKLAANPNARTNRHHANFLNSWWHLSWARGEMKEKLNGLSRYVACSNVTKAPIFAFLSREIRPNARLQVFTFDDDYSFGIIQSGLHWKWLVERCATLGKTPTYTSTTVWNSFPWPQAPALAEAAAVAEAAVALRQLRTGLMQKHGMSFRDLYRTLDEPGANPLRAAHARLDAAVRAAYGWAPEAEPLAALLALNHAVADRQSAGEPVVGPGLPPSVRDPAPFVTADCIGPPPTP